MKLNQILKANAVAIAAVIFSGAVMSFKVMEKSLLTNSTFTTAVICQKVLLLKSPTGRKEQAHLVLLQETDLVR